MYANVGAEDLTSAPGNRRQYFEVLILNLECGAMALQCVAIERGIYYDPH